MTAKTYSCPKCGVPLRSSPKGPLGGVREVSTKDINVEKDILLCPSCGEVSSFSAVIGGMSEDALDYIAALLKREESLRKEKRDEIELC